MLKMKSYGYLCSNRIWKLKDFPPKRFVPIFQLLNPERQARDPEPPCYLFISFKYVFLAGCRSPPFKVMHTVCCSYKFRSSLFFKKKIKISYNTVYCKAHPPLKVRNKANEDFKSRKKKGRREHTTVLFNQGHQEVPKPKNYETKASWNHVGILV